MNYLKVIFPGMMVVGALGSMIVSIKSEGFSATGLQWLGACLLYTALTFRNV